MQPKLAISFAAAVIVLHCCAAAPNAYYSNSDILLRPSPINPDIPMDPKPAETITFITDPKEIAKFKREIKIEAAKHDITAPTTIPPKHAHPLHQPEQLEAIDHNEQMHRHHHNYQQQEQQHRQTRDTKTSASTTTKPPLNIELLNDKQTVKKILTTVKPKRTRDHTSSRKSTSQTTTTTTTVASTGQIKHRQKRFDKNYDVPLNNSDQHKQPSASQSTIKPQTLPFIFENTSVKQKRDIPVPLVPKYHHPEESPKDEDKEDTNKTTEHTTSATTTSTAKQISESSEEKKHEKRTVTENSDAVQVEDLSEQHQQQQHSTKQQEQHHQDATSSTTESSLFRHQPVPVAELFAKGKSTETSEHDRHEIN